MSLWEVNSALRDPSLRSTPNYELVCCGSPIRTDMSRQIMGSKAVPWFFIGGKAVIALPALKENIGLIGSWTRIGADQFPGTGRQGPRSFKKKDPQLLASRPIAMS